jgi:hypothetical protein
MSVGFSYCRQKVGFGLKITIHHLNEHNIFMFGMLRLLIWIFSKPAEILANAMLRFESVGLTSGKAGKARTGAFSGMCVAAWCSPQGGGAGGHMTYLG